MAKLLILFIHGLGGRAESWGAFKDLLESDGQLADQADVAFYSYPTKLLRFLPSWRSLKIQEIAQGLRTEINTRHASYDTILLVAHSMGGLVAKHYINEAIKRNEPLRVRGVVLFAVPNSGSEFAAISDAISVRHSHIRQLRKDSDFVSMVMNDWIRSEPQLLTRNVVAGQDMVIAAITHHEIPNTEMIPDKGHGDIVKPSNDDDVSFLIVKQAALELVSNDREADLVLAREAIEEKNSYALTNLIANRGRSWLETTFADNAIDILTEVVAAFDSTTPEVVWSQYLLAISRLFREGDASSTAFNDDLIRNSEAIGLAPLLVAEKMEFARKRRDRPEALKLALQVMERLQNVKATSAGSAYAIGTAHFLLGNLFRFGGNYSKARDEIAKARSFYRPSILAHQIELAHCQYATAVCRTMEGVVASEELQTVSVGVEFRNFSEALLILTRSHGEWLLGRVGEAAELAERAAQVFQQIRFVTNSRARRLSGLLKAWQRLELGAPPDKAIAQAPEDAPMLRGMLGQKAARGTVHDDFSSLRPSRALGLLQFASAYNPDPSEDIGEFSLPPVLATEDGVLVWTSVHARSLTEAEATMRSMMKIQPHNRVPLIGD